VAQVAHVSALCGTCVIVAREVHLCLYLFHMLMEHCRPRDIDDWTRVLEEDLLHPVHHNVLVTAREDDSTRYRCCWCGDKILGVVCEVSVGRCAHFLCACLAKIHGAERRHWRRVRRHEHRQRWEASRSRKSKTASSYSIRGSRTALIHTRHIEQLQPRANFLRGGGFTDDEQLPQADSREHNDSEGLYRISGLPAHVAVFDDVRARSFRNLSTVGDGDCAIHAAFGDLVNGSVRCRKPRVLLSSAFGPTSQAFEASVDDPNLVQRFKKNLWLNAYKVCARKELGQDVNESDIGAEEKSLWKNLQGTL
jgi:hypothetical protein